MIPITQTKFSDDANGVHGNCMAACVASLLEIDIADVPAWENMGSDGSWADSYYAFLRAHGYESEGMALRNDNTVDGLWDFVLGDDCDCPGVDGYFIVGGDSPRISRGHAVIYKDRCMVHDPHPSGVGINSITEVYLIQKSTEFENVSLPPERRKCAACGEKLTILSVGYAGMSFCDSGCVEYWVDQQE